MKRRFHKTLALISIVCILTLGISSVVFAAVAESPYKEATVFGHTYEFQAWVQTFTDSIAAATYVRADGNVPTGYMGAQARLYDSDDNLILTSSWEYNDEELAGFAQYTDYYYRNGDYYSYGLVKLYNGNGYNTYYTYRSPILTLDSGLSYWLKDRNISNYQYQVNEYGETYGSGVYAEILGEEPDLIAAIGIDGTFGYVRSSDLDPAPRTPEEAIAQNNLGDKLIPLYDKDGRTVIGQFRIVSGRIEYFTDDKN